MAGLDRHAMLPVQTSRERDRHAFLVDLKGYIVNELEPVLKAVYERRVAPLLDNHATGRTADRHAVAELMDPQPETRMVNALARAQHELYVDSTSACVYAQAPELAERYRSITTSKAAASAGGSLHLDPGVTPPWYQQEVDTHCIPGSYFNELLPDDVSAGARYDIGLHLFSRGQRGALNDRSGQHGVTLVRQRYPDLEPRDIVDLGCGIGNATVPYADAWPKATVTGIDTAAPLLRYAHARAISLGKAIHFRQDDAEHLRLADQSMDIVGCHILLHETSLAATRNILREAHRVLRPGGVFVSVDVPRRLTARTPYQQYRAAWDALHNNEPYFGSLLFDVDLPGIAVEAGFDAGSIHEEVTRGAAGTDTYGYWGFIAQKPA